MLELPVEETEKKINNKKIESKAKRRKNPRKFLESNATHRQTKLRKGG